MTHPTPTHPISLPPPTRCFSTELHDPHPTTFAPEVGIENFECLGVNPPPPTQGHLPLGAGPTPRLGEVISDAERLAVQLINVLARQYDPESAPVGAPGEPDVVLSDVHLGRAVGLVHAAVAELEAVTALLLPAAGSAVPAHTDVSRARSGGPGTDSRLRVSTSPYLVYTAGAYSTAGATS